MYHLNIKPSNVLAFKVDKDIIFKLTDCQSFDYFRPIEASQMTHPFESPERLNHHHKGPECDVWSLGVLVCTLL